jgi:hypothetical protein
VSIVATVNLTRHEAKILYVNHVARAMVPATVSSRRAALRLTDAQGKVLGEDPVQVRETTDILPGEDRTALIDAVIPDRPETATIELLLLGKVVDRLRVSKSAPMVNGVKVLAPRAEDSPLDITWEATDPDGDKLTYVVQISSDGGKTWETLAIGLKEARLTLTADQVRGRRQGLIRVTANDGYHSSKPVERPLPSQRPDAPAPNPGGSRD